MTHKDDETSLKKAKNAVFRLLKIRLRSEQELRKKLELKHFPQSIIKQTIQYFRHLQLIDDRLFAKSWIASRLKKPFGKRRIQYELKHKGIAESIIKEEFDLLEDSYAEEEVILDLAKNRIRKYKGIDEQKQKQRLYGYLSRRGFQTDKILKALRKL